jgi:hypothetical protein
VRSRQLSSLIDTQSPGSKASVEFISYDHYWGVVDSRVLKTKEKTHTLLKFGHHCQAMSDHVTLSPPLSFQCLLPSHYLIQIDAQPMAVPAALFLQTQFSENMQHASVLVAMSKGVLCA